MKYKILFFVFLNLSLASTCLAIPNAPSALNISSAVGSRVSIEWTDNSSDEQGFRIYRSVDGVVFLAHNAVSTNQTQISDNRLITGRTYYYQVTSFNLTGESAVSNTASVVVGAGGSAPTAPSALSANAQDAESILLSWTDNSNNEASFRVERSLTGIGGWSEISSVAANTTNFENTGLSASTSYYYRVRARNATGDSAYTSVASDTTSAPEVNTISINNGGASTSTTSVLLNLFSQNFSDEMYITNTAGCGSGGSWQNYSTTKTWTLGTASGTASVYVKFRDSGLNESSCVSDSISVDNSPPDAPNYSNISPSSPNASTTPLVTGTISATDIQEIEFYDSDACFNPIGSGSKAEYTGAGIEVSIPLAQAVSIYARAFDTSGNASPCTFQTSYTNSASNAGTWRPVREPTGIISDYGKAVWTGSELFTMDAYSSNKAALYNPATDSWRPASSVNAPSAREGYSIAWTGSEVIVWGGQNSSLATDLNDGARYNPLTDTWTSMSTASAPAGRHSAQEVWTGTEFVVWGGLDASYSNAFNTGGRYNPATDTWTSITTTGAPSARFDFTAIWSGTEMILWGGYNMSYSLLNTGGRYNPATDTWTSITTTGAPSGSSAHQMVWTGSLALIWGSNSVATGSRYNPATDSWQAISSTNAPAYSQHSLVWTGDRMISYGGGAAGTSDTGGSYNPASDTWTPINPATVGSRYHKAVWTGEEMIVWGGIDSGGKPRGLNGIYTPGTDSWTESSDFIPTPRWSHFSVWTGSEMMVWAGTGGGNPHTLRDGGLYDPITNSWSSVSTTNAPAGGQGGSLVWADTEAIFWGGYNLSSVRVNTGAKYNPVNDTWSATTTSGAPSARYFHSAVWADPVMIIWGGNVGSNTNTGSRYNPALDSWAATTTTGAPSARSSSPAVWTGSDVIIWGGGFGTNLNTGARYNPTADTWTTITTTGAPSARSEHRMVWTGSEMIVHGGKTGGGVSSGTNTGGVYNPAGDSWTATSTTSAPIHQGHAAAWTGSHLLVWGGSATTSDSITTGSLYDPDLDSWAAITSVGAPALGAFMGWVWADTELIVWGGIGSSSRGGIFKP